MVIAAQVMRDRAARNFRRMGNARVANAVSPALSPWPPSVDIVKTGPNCRFEPEPAGRLFGEKRLKRATTQSRQETAQ